MLTPDQINQHVWRKDQYITQHEIGLYQIVEYWSGRPRIELVVETGIIQQSGKA